MSTIEDYEEALKRIDELIAIIPQEGSEAFDELDKLGALVVAYEEIHYSISTE